MSTPKKSTPTDTPISLLLAARWSSLAFDPSPLTDAEVAALFEAARWAPSCYNEQPWRYVYAQKNDAGRDAIESLLMDGNSWAKNASVLIVGFAKSTFERNNKPNAYHLHDTGAASLQLVLQATHMGLVSHQMAGFAADTANTVLGVPADFVPTSMIAIGHAGIVSDLAEDLQTRENAMRTRKPYATFAFRERWVA